MRVDEQVQSGVFDATQLSDDELIVRLKRCVAQDRQLTARLLEHFGEVSARGLYRDQGYPSMFLYAVHGLHMSESEAGLRIRVSRLGRMFPEALRMLARGELHMTALRLLAPVLTHDNVGLLHEARFKTKQQVLELRAKHFPMPDAPALNRKLPSRTVAGTARPVAIQSMPSAMAETSRSEGPVAAHEQANTGSAQALDASVVPTDPLSSDAMAASAGFIDRTASVVGSLERVHATGQAKDEPSERAAAGEAAQRRPSSTRADATAEFRLESPEPAVVIPLSEGRYLVRFTADQPMQNKLTQAQELMRHEVPRGDFVAVFDRALDLLIAERKKKLFGLRTTSRSSRTPAPSAAKNGPSANATATPAATVAGPGAPTNDDVQTPAPTVAGPGGALANDAAQTPAGTVAGSNGAPANAAATLAATVAGAHGASANDATQTLASTVAGSADETSVRPGGSSGLHAVELEEVGMERARTSNAPAQPQSQRSKYIPRAVRRDVMARDGLQCTFIGPEGNRCPERGRLQLDHYPVPAGCGGPATTVNLRVRCAAHNLLAAEHFYGRDRVLRKIAASRVSVSQDGASYGPERVAGEVSVSQDGASYGPERVAGDVSVAQDGASCDPERVAGDGGSGTTRGDAHASSGLPIAARERELRRQHQDCPQLR